MAPTIVLITGANRGIGKGLLELYLAKPNHTVIAANRTPDDPTSKVLAELPKAEGTILLVTKIDATSATDPTRAVKDLASRGINHIDILIANAGIALLWPKVSEVKVEDIQTHVDTNVYGLIHLYQAFRPLLRKARGPKWVTIGSNFIPMQNAAYAPTKVVQHWYTKAIAVEEPWLTAFPIDPGWVQTDLGNRGADAFGYEKAAVTIEDSVNGLVKVIDASTLETHSGKLFKHDGAEEPW
ncbi:Short-chain dehydrogenase/reductase SDR [Penicillium alfredii]|uniref:Short-chain dehydrogenase/reductase SDR n=1 Tax=Penicillium alfredii TaxID=1506179 RepID=A0A9W9ERW1_9EURO|nr:Short-chain dehydrogenase/reductase SDR [Penicillium alfredii]KAJ5086872.1 Short-chain dehydrogenase/reductase SDR [Penicillium alfredii]